MIVVSLYASVNLWWFGLERCFLLLVYVVLRSGIRMGDLFHWCIAFRWHVFLLFILISAFLLFIYVRKVKFLAFGSLFSFNCGKIVLDRDRGYANKKMIFRFIILLTSLHEQVISLLLFVLLDNLWSFLCSLQLSSLS